MHSHLFVYRYITIELQHLCFRIPSLNSLSGNPVSPSHPLFTRLSSPDDYPSICSVKQLSFKFRLKWTFRFLLMLNREFSMDIGQHHKHITFALCEETCWISLTWASEGARLFQSRIYSKWMPLNHKQSRMDEILNDTRQIFEMHKCDRPQYSRPHGCPDVNAFAVSRETEKHECEI
jgi:hypothetical protein